MTTNKVPKSDYVRLNIRHWREERRWKQKDLAKAVGISASGIVYLEQGSRPIKMEVLFRIAEALQVDVAKFLEEPPAQHTAQLPPPGDEIAEEQ